MKGDCYTNCVIRESQPAGRDWEGKKPVPAMWSASCQKPSHLVSTSNGRFDLSLSSHNAWFVPKRLLTGRLGWRRNRTESRLPQQQIRVMNVVWSTRASWENRCLKISGARSWIGLCSVLRPRQHSLGYMGDGFYRSKDPTNSIKVLRRKL